ncbi:hypothetical protein ACS6YO_08075 [Streptococcus suis]
MKKKVDNSELYVWVYRLNKIMNIVFYVNVVIALFLIVLQWDLIIKIQIIISIIAIIGNFVNDYFVFPCAEKGNLERNMGNAFEKFFRSDIIEDNYYDNGVEPSVKKFIINSFENILYTKTILRYMLWRDIFKFVFYILVFIMCTFFVNSSNALSIVVQTLFSTQYILGAANNLIYYYRTKSLYESFYNEYQNYGFQELKLLGFAIEYEVLKSSHKTLIDSKIYDKQKNKIEEEWKKIKEEFEII